MDAQIVYWLEEMSDFENASSQFVSENVLEGSRSSYHSDHNTDTEHSADNDDTDKQVPSPITVPSEIQTIRRQRTYTTERSLSRYRRHKRTIQPRDKPSTRSSSDDDELLTKFSTTIY
ncbi:unnamed protein product [Parnassius apollo]|uniref:(apollo) hypothetical protein n=1 Tax=Parnassius apollo TaxID=110799 RepID=A0A8S3XKE0_PARAO|nr:unnamed protein product [Parnassius apollo]